MDNLEEMDRFLEKLSSKTEPERNNKDQSRNKRKRNERSNSKD